LGLTALVFTTILIIILAMITTILAMIITLMAIIGPTILITILAMIITLIILNIIGKKAAPGAILAMITTLVTLAIIGRRAAPGRNNRSRPRLRSGVTVKQPGVGNRLISACDLAAREKPCVESAGLLGRGRTLGCRPRLPSIL
jgi:hypothetical protein